MDKIKFAVLLLAFLLLFTACSSEEGTAKKKGCFDNTEWGMTTEDVSNSVDYTLTETQKNTTYSATNPEEIEIDFLIQNEAKLEQLHFDFDKENGLVAVRLIAVPNGYSMQTIIQNIKKHLNELYVYKADNPQNTEIWETETGAVTLSAFNTRLFIDFEVGEKQ